MGARNEPCIRLATAPKDIAASGTSRGEMGTLLHTLVVACAYVLSRDQFYLACRYTALGGVVTIFAGFNVTSEVRG